MLEEINSIRKDIQEYLEVQLDLIRLHTAESLSRVFSKIAIFAITGFLLLLILIFFSLAAGFYLGEIMGSEFIGFLIVSGFYLVVLIAFLLLRKKLVERPIIKAMVKIMFPNQANDEN